jgi:hypothetical protein
VVPAPDAARLLLATASGVALDSHWVVGRSHRSPLELEGATGPSAGWILAIAGPMRMLAPPRRKPS